MQQKHYFSKFCIIKFCMNVHARDRINVESFLIPIEETEECQNGKKGESLYCLLCRAVRE